MRYEDLVENGRALPAEIDASVGLPDAPSPEAFVDHNQRYFDGLDESDRARLRAKAGPATRRTIERWGYSFDTPLTRGLWRPR